MGFTLIARQADIITSKEQLNSAPACHTNGTDKEVNVTALNSDTAHTHTHFCILSFPPGM